MGFGTGVRIEFRNDDIARVSRWGWDRVLGPRLWSYFLVGSSRVSGLMSRLVRDRDPGRVSGLMSRLVRDRDRVGFRDCGKGRDRGRRFGSGSGFRV